MIRLYKFTVDSVYHSTILQIAYEALIDKTGAIVISSPSLVVSHDRILLYGDENSLVLRWSKMLLACITLQLIACYSF